MTVIEVAVPVKSPTNDDAVTTPAKVVSPFALIVPPAPATPNSIPLLAVINPTESIFVTSSYVKVPPTDTFPVTFNELNVPSEVTFGCAAVWSVPAKVVAVIIPDELTLVSCKPVECKNESPILYPVL